MTHSRRWLFLVTLTAFFTLNIFGGFHSHTSPFKESQCTVCKAIHVSVSDVPLQASQSSVIFEESQITANAVHVVSFASHATHSSRSPPAL